MLILWKGTKPKASCVLSKNSTTELHQHSMLVLNVSLKQAEACKLHGTVSSKFHRPPPVDWYSAEHSRQCGQSREATFDGTSTRPYVLCTPEKTQSVWTFPQGIPPAVTAKTLWKVSLQWLLYWPQPLLCSLRHSLTLQWPARSWPCWPWRIASPTWRSD